MPILAVVVSNEKPGAFTPGRSFSQLMCHPSIRWMSSSGDVNDAAR